MRKDTETSESLSLNVNNTAPDEGLVNALTDVGGPAWEPCQTCLASVPRAKKTWPKPSLRRLAWLLPKRRKKAKVSKPEDTVEMVPKTIMEQAMDKSDDVLKAATEARKFALHLQHVNYSGELVQGLMGFSTRMESHFKQLKELKAKQESNPHVYEKVLQGICRGTNKLRQGGVRHISVFGAHLSNY